MEKINFSSARCACLLCSFPSLPRVAQRAASFSSANASYKFLSPNAADEYLQRPRLRIPLSSDEPCVYCVFLLEERMFS